MDMRLGCGETRNAHRIRCGNVFRGDHLKHQEILGRITLRQVARMGCGCDFTSCPMSDFGYSGFECSGSATTSSVS